MSIYKKLSDITMEINTVAKNLRVGEGKVSYKAVSEADVLAAVKPIEAKHGVYSFPISRELVSEDIMTSRSEYNGQVKETPRLFMRLKTTYRFVDIETEEFVDVQTYGDGVDSQDKAPGKAMTYADKYALLKAYKIQTGDDPDQEMSQDLVGMREAKKYDIPKDAMTCSECGKQIDERVFNWSIEHYMRPLCRDCQKEVTDGSERV